jgi:hypothetical protein
MEAITVPVSSESQEELSGEFIPDDLEDAASDGYEEPEIQESSDDAPPAIPSMKKKFKFKNTDQ